MADFLVFVGFWAIVWAGCVTLLYIMASRDLAELRIKDQLHWSRLPWGLRHASDAATTTPIRTLSMLKGEELANATTHKSV